MRSICYRILAEQLGYPISRTGTTAPAAIDCRKRQAVIEPYATKQNAEQFGNDDQTKPPKAKVFRSGLMF